MFNLKRGGTVGWDELNSRIKHVQCLVSIAFCRRHIIHHVHIPDQWRFWKPFCFVEPFWTRDNLWAFEWTRGSFVVEADYLFAI